MSKKKILITGSCGFIYSNFIRKAIYEKYPYEFISIDRVNNPADLNNIYSNKNHTFYLADIRDRHIINNIFEFEKPDIVIHGAAESSVDASIKDPGIFVEHNVVGTQVIIEASLKHKIEKFVYVSTDEIYGMLKSEHDASWTENNPIDPQNPYSASKAAGELLVKAAHNTFGLQYLITRSSNNYGPRQTSNKLIPRIIKSIINKEPIPIYGQGLQIRDWTHVFDNCAGLLKILNSDVINETYNISANQEYRNIEVVQMVCNAVGDGHSLITHIKDPRPGHDFRYSVDASKLRALGWKPEFKFKEAIGGVCEWYMNNQWWFRK